MRVETAKIISYDGGYPQVGRRCPEALPDCDIYNPIVWDGRVVASVRSLVLPLSGVGIHEHLAVSTVTLLPEVLALFVEPLRSAVWPDYWKRPLFSRSVSPEWGEQVSSTLAPRGPFTFDGKVFLPRIVTLASEDSPSGSGARQVSDWTITPRTGVAMRRDLHTTFFTGVTQRLEEYFRALYDLPQEVVSVTRVPRWGEGSPSVQIVRDAEGIRALREEETPKATQSGRNLLY